MLAVDENERLMLHCCTALIATVLHCPTVASIYSPVASLLCTLRDLIEWSAASATEPARDMGSGTVAQRRRLALCLSAILALTAAASFVHAESSQFRCAMLLRLRLR